MEYIVRKRAKFDAICGCVNLPYGTVLELDDRSGIIFWQDKPLCAATSQNAHDFLALNSDGQGARRGSLLDAICKLLAKRDADYQTRWNKVWADVRCQQYRRADCEDFWVWAHSFFGAPISDLIYIAQLVGAAV